MDRNDMSYIIPFNNIWGLTQWKKDGNHMTLVLSDNAIEWANKTLDYQPELIITAAAWAEIANVTLSFRDRSDFLLFYIAFAQHWRRPLVT